MKKPVLDRMAHVRLLGIEETKTVSGGSIVSFLVKFAQWGAGYFFRMGVQEGKKMRAQL